MNFKITVIIICLLFSVSATYSQENKMETDRPGQTNTPFTVPVKWFQVETGFTRYSDKINPPSKELYFQHPSLSVKYGLADLIEFRLVTEYATFTEKVTNGTFRNSGISKVQLGGKLNFLQENGPVPTTSLIATYNFNRLQTVFKDSVDGVNVRLAMQYMLTDKLLLGYNIGIEWNRFGSNPAYIYTLSPKYVIGEKWLLHAELFGYIWNDRPPQHTIDAGIAWLINNDLKADLSGGFGVNKEAPDNYYSLGMSFRFRD